VSRYFSHGIVHGMVGDDRHDCLLSEFVHWHKSMRCDLCSPSARNGPARPLPIPGPSEGPGKVQAHHVRGGGQMQTVFHDNAFRGESSRGSNGFVTRASSTRGRSHCGVETCTTGRSLLTKIPHDRTRWLLHTLSPWNAPALCPPVSVRRIK